MLELIEILFVGAVCGLWSILFAMPLQDDGEIFSFVRRLANAIVDPGWQSRGDMVNTEPDGKTILRWWAYKVLTCPKCMSFYWTAIYFITQYYFGVTVFHVFFLASTIASFIAYYFSERMF